MDPATFPGDPTAAGDLAAAYTAALGPVAQARVVVWAWHHDPDLEPSTVDRLGATLGRFAARQRTLGRVRLAETTVDDAVGFVWARTRRGADPSIATVHLRRAALRLAFRTLAGPLGVRVADPTVGLVLPAKTRAELRPLDDAEIGLLRIAAAGRSRSRLLAMATVALAEATATTGEIATIRWRDIDPESGTVALPGAGRVAPRTGRTTVWGTAALAQLHQAGRRSLGELVGYRGAADPDSQPAQATVVNRLTHLLKVAGLDGDDIRPASVRLWRPARALADGDRIETVANQLGLASLDTTAALLDHQWRAGR